MSLDAVSSQNGETLAAELARFLRELEAAPAEGGPAAGEHNFHRGGSLAVYDRETRDTIALCHTVLGYRSSELTQIWERALNSSWRSPPVWIHGDVASGNLLVANDSLCGVIDFGIMGIGDPACDLVMVWTYFTSNSRSVFIDAMEMDDDVWQRACGWAFWKALITFAASRATQPSKASEAKKIIDEIMATA